MRRSSVIPLAALAVACGGGRDDEAPDPCGSGDYEVCFETFPEAESASVAENPETTVRFEGTLDGDDVLVFLDVPSGADPGDALDVAFRGTDEQVAVQMSIGEDTFWGDRGTVTIERNDGERIVGLAERLVLDESLRDPADGDRLAYLGRLEFDRPVEHTGD